MGAAGADPASELGSDTGGLPSETATGSVAETTGPEGALEGVSTGAAGWRGGTGAATSASGGGDGSTGAVTSAGAAAVAPREVVFLTGLPGSSG